MKTKLAILVLVLVAVLVATAPVSAEPKPHLVGDRISVSISAQEFPANEPFHIWHGWAYTPGPGEEDSEEDGKENPCKDAWDFSLTYSHPQTVPVDDPKDRPYTEPDLSTSPPQLILGHLYEFRAGAGPGVVTFTGYWYAPCETAVAEGWWTGTCESACASVEVHSRSTEVTFTE